MLDVIYAECLKYELYAESHYAECRYAECLYAECRGADKMWLFSSSLQFRMKKSENFWQFIKIVSKNFGGKKIKTNFQCIRECYNFSSWPLL
jgi:hypothetical protein